MDTVANPAAFGRQDAERAAGLRPPVFRVGQRVSIIDHEPLTGFVWSVDGEDLYTVKLDSGEREGFHGGQIEALQEEILYWLGDRESRIPDTQTNRGKAIGMVADLEWRLNQANPAERSYKNVGEVEAAIAASLREIGSWESDGEFARCGLIIETLVPDPPQPQAHCTRCKDAIAGETDALCEASAEPQEQGGHTPGLLDCFLGNANGRGLCRLEVANGSEGAGEHVASGPRGAVNEARFGRLSTCYNACDGLSTAQIEALGPGGVAKLLAAAGEFLAATDALGPIEGEYDALSERDEDGLLDDEDEAQLGELETELSAAQDRALEAHSTLRRLLAGIGGGK